LRYLFEEYAFDTDRRELLRGADVVSIAPQVFDLLDYLIRNRERVVSKDDLINAIWNGRIVSDGALTTRLNVARSAIGDSGDEQRLIKTPAPERLPVRRCQCGKRRVPTCAEVADHPVETAETHPHAPGKPSIAVLPFANLSSDPEQEVFRRWRRWRTSRWHCRAFPAIVIARNSKFYLQRPGHGREAGPAASLV
jgi:adenylate cyclase